MTPSQKFRDFCVKCNLHKAVRRKAHEDCVVEHFCIAQTKPDRPLQCIYMHHTSEEYTLFDPYSVEHYNKTLEQHGVGMVGCPYLLEFMMKEENDTL